jgi:acyl-CoA thioester hydrolase
VEHTPTLPLILKLRIDWSEQDLFGHINNVMFNKYVQSARVNLWEQIGLTAYHQQTNIGATLAATSVQFKKPLHYPGQISIHSGISVFKNTSFVITHHIYNHAQELCATAEDVVVIFDYHKNEKVVIPEFIRENYGRLA